MPAHKILFVSPTAKVGGGGEVVLTYIIRSLCQSGYECIVAVPFDGEYVRTWRDLGCRLFDIPLRALTGKTDIRSFNIRFYWEVFWSYLKTNFVLSRAIRVHKPDIIYVNSFWAIFYAAAVSRLLRRRVIWHVHDLIAPKLLNRIAISTIAKFVDRIIVISSAVGNRLVAAGASDEKIVLIHNGIDVDRFCVPQPVIPPLSREKLGLPKESFVVLIAGRLIPRKGHTTLIKAFGILATTYSHVRLVVLGAPYDFNSERYMERLKRLVVSLGLQERVLFVGWQERVEQFLHVADVVVSASWAEPFGLTIVESMAAGRPVIATEGGGEPDIVIDGVTGLLVEPNNEIALASAISKLIEDGTLCTNMGMAGLQRAREYFSVSRFSNDIVGVMNHLM